MEQRIRDFINNKRAIRFASVMILFGISLHFLFIALFETNLLEEVISFGSEGVNRLVSLFVSIGIAIVTYGAYRQDEEVVNTRLRELKQRISEEAKEIRREVSEKKEEEKNEPDSAK